jgi:hypothetical protein
VDSDGVEVKQQQVSDSPSVETEEEFEVRLAQGMEEMRGRAISLDTLNFGEASEDEDSDGEIEAAFMDDLEGTDLSSFGLVRRCLPPPPSPPRHPHLLTRLSLT